MDLVPFARAVEALYARHIAEAGKQPQALILASFLVTFVAVRAVTHAIRAGRLGGVLHDVRTSGGTHLHHLVPGILLLLAVGYLGIGVWPAQHRDVLAVLFGIGAALTLDEFALWLRLEDVYWAREGRASVDAVIVTAAVLALGLLGGEFWLGLARELSRLARLE